MVQVFINKESLKNVFQKEYYMFSSKKARGIMKNLFWIDRKDFYWKDELTVTADSPYSKELVTMKLFYEKDGLVGIPRYFLDKPVIEKDLRVAPICRFPDFKIELYKEQEEACNEILDYFKNHTGGILLSKAGTGKTLMALNIAGKMGLKVLILVHKNDLFEQWKERIKMCFGDIEIGEIKGKKRKIEDITVGMFQTIHSQRLALDGFFGLVIVDETHHVSAWTFCNVIRNLDAKYFLGLTATPRRSDGLEDVFFWHIGKIITECKLTHLKGEFFQLKYEPISFRIGSVNKYIKDNLSRAINVLVNDQKRNLWIIKTAQKAIKKGRKVLILSGRIAHCEMLHKAIPDSALYIGRMKKKELKEATKAQCIIGTYGMFAEGTDLPELDTLIFATPVAEIEQAVGRIQRPFPGKKEPYVIDIFDKGIPLLEGMGWKRRKILKKLGFKEKI